MVPTVVVTSLRQRFPMETVKLFTHSMVQLVLLLEERNTAEELMQMESEREIEEAESRKAQAQTKQTPGTESGRQSPRSHVVTAIDVENAARSFCAQLLASVSECGFQTVTLVSSQWTRDVAQPQTMAFRFGLECIERPAQIMFPSSLFIKPLVSSQEFVRAVAASAHRTLQQSNSVCVLPAFVDSEFMVPGLLVKYFMFLHGGFTWNYTTTTDILWVEREVGPLQWQAQRANSSVLLSVQGDSLGSEGMPSDGATSEGPAPQTHGRFDGSIARDVLSLLLFKQPADDVNIETAAILSLLTGELFSPHEADSLDAAALVSIDRVLWALLTSPASVNDIPLPPKADTALCLKVHKRLLNLAKWNPSSTSGARASSSSSSSDADGSQTAARGLASGIIGARAWLWGASAPAPALSLEVDELLSVVHLASVATKAIVLAHSIQEKQHANGAGSNKEEGGAQMTPTLGAALALLPPGLNSDAANSLLEALERCVGLWRRRFRSLSILRSASSGAPGPARRLVTFSQARARFFRGQMHGVPTMAFLGTRGGVREKLPRPEVVDDTVKRLFSETQA